MWDLAVREADFASANAFLERYRGPPPWSRRALPAFAAGDSAAVERLLEEARGAENRQLQIGARWLATFMEDLDEAERLARLDLDWRQNPRLRADARLLIAWLAIARGRWSSAAAEFAAAGRMEGATDVVIHQAMAATLPFLRVPRTDLEMVTAAVERWQPGRDVPPGLPGTAAALRPHLRHYLLGLLYSRLGREPDALRQVETIRGIAAPPEATPVVQALAQTVLADAALEAGRPQEALAHLSGVNGEIPFELVSRPAFVVIREFGQEHARYIRAESLHRMGEEAEATRWWQSGFQNAPNEFAYQPWVHLRLGQALGRAGENREAARHYGRFVASWEACDPALRPLVESARAELTRLAGAR